jgi:hypothetical protein
VLLSPVWSQPAFPLGFDIASLDNAIATLELMRPVLPANLLGTPAAVVPAGMAEGLPVGVQVMGGKYTAPLPGRRRGDRAATRRAHPDRPGYRLTHQAPTTLAGSPAAGDPAGDQDSHDKDGLDSRRIRHVRSIGKH